MRCQLRVFQSASPAGTRRPLSALKSSLLPRFRPRPRPRRRGYRPAMARLLRHCPLTPSRMGRRTELSDRFGLIPTAEASKRWSICRPSDTLHRSNQANITSVISPAPLRSVALFWCQVLITLVACLMNFFSLKSECFYLDELLKLELSVTFRKLYIKIASPCAIGGKGVDGRG